LLPVSAVESAAGMPLGSSQLAPGSNPITAIYSGNTIAIGCCTASSPPGGGLQVQIYPPATSAPLEIACRSLRSPQPNTARARGRGAALPRC
jgi:hypothetical protein